MPDQNARHQKASRKPLRTKAGRSRKPGAATEPSPPAAADKTTKDDKTAKGAKSERIAKLIARAGLCSRRDAERWIADGRVQLDGKVLETAAVAVRPGQSILVDGQPLPAPERARLWRFHKPKGVITSRRDPEGRPTVFDGLPADLPRLEPVGRLDFNSEGLLLFTNAGELKRRLELPSTGWSRRYRVRVHGKVDPAQLTALEKGITVEGINYGPIQARLEHQAATNAWLAMTLREGKNREIRRICEHLGLTVNRLIRVSYGPFQLGDLAPGKIESVPARILRDQLGLESPAAEQAGKEEVKVKAGNPKPARPRTHKPKAAAPGGKTRKTVAPGKHPPKGATDLTDMSPAKTRGKRGKPSKPNKPAAGSAARPARPKGGGAHAHRRRPS